MEFNSVEFLIFLPAIVILYYLLPKKWRWVLLLGASYYFYMSWKAKYAALIFSSTLIDYVVARLIHASTKGLVRKLLLCVSLVTNLGLLFIFKYYNFFRGELEDALLSSGLDNLFPILWFVLPVGISFYTFQTISYTIDVYLRKQEPEKHFGHFALYVSFFPQLVAGPIERFSHLGPQLKKLHDFKYENLANGAKLVLLGLFVKMCIADNISPIVDHVYAAPEAYSSPQVLLGMFLYSIQIYSDFFGYSTIAIGAAGMLGIKLVDNFKSPYFASSITEFWQRWHISLTSWFRQYLYLPLGGNRVSLFRWIVNVTIVFLISGFWHGANWTFIIWGGIHALIFLLERLISGYFKIKIASLHPALRMLGRIKTFLVVTLAWVFFRSQTLDHALEMLRAAFGQWEHVSELHISLEVWLLLLFFFVLDYVLRNHRFDYWINGKPLLMRWSVYTLLLFSVLALGGVTNHPFIYFQF